MQTIQAIEAALQPFVPLVGQLTGKDTTLERIIPIMKLLGNPEQKLRVIHLAGTSGKTSTAYYVAALLGGAGKNVGLTVSPHVDSITERVQLNGVPMVVATFGEQLTEFLEIIGTAATQPSYFELLYAFALWVFARSHVDYAVVETGMGGLYDATNIVTRADKLCIITDIGKDHTHILGNTLTAIASQKIGIVHEHNQTLMYKQVPEVMAVVRAWNHSQQAPLLVTTEARERQFYGGDLQALPAYQQHNWLLAYRAYRLLQKRDELAKLTPARLRLTQQLQVPGRMDGRCVQGKEIIMDGAHNAQKMTAFMHSFGKLYPGTKPAIMLALKNGKDYLDVVAILAPLAGQVIVTSFATSQDLPVISMEPEQLGSAFRRAGAREVQIISDQQTAFRALLAAPGSVCIITGSFYLLSQIRNNEALMTAATNI